MTDRTEQRASTSGPAESGGAQRAPDAADGAERLARAAVAEHPESADAVLALARVLLEQQRGREALDVIDAYASRTRLPGDESSSTKPGPDAAVSEAAVFDSGVSDDELDRAFEDAQPERERMVDADSIAQRAIRQTDTDLSGDFASPEVSYATETVAGLLERQGDAPTASRIRASMSGARAARPSEPTRSSGQPPDRRAATIRELERWLENLRGGVQP